MLKAMTRGRTFQKKTHATSKTANGHKPTANGSPRLAVSFDADDFRRAQWFADKRGIPLAEVIRVALWAYLLPVKADADRAAGLEIESE